MYILSLYPFLNVALIKVIFSFMNFSVCSSIFSLELNPSLSTVSNLPLYTFLPGSDFGSISRDRRDSNNQISHLLKIVEGIFSIISARESEYSFPNIFSNMIKTLETPDLPLKSIFIDFVPFLSIIETRIPKSDILLIMGRSIRKEKSVINPLSSIIKEYIFSGSGKFPFGKLDSSEKNSFILFSVIELGLDFLTASSIKILSKELKF